MHDTSSHSLSEMRPTPRIINLSLVEALAATHLGELNREVMAVLAISILISAGWFFL
jgi:hypothetical protein